MKFLLLYGASVVHMEHGNLVGQNCRGQTYYINAIHSNGLCVSAQETK